jgi:hypothetical protein
MFSITIIDESFRTKLYNNDTDLIGGYMRNKIDKRTLRTKKAIKEAFTQLYLNHPLEEINVVDIAKLAEISRKTFYYYYEGIWELVEEIENDMTQDIINCISSSDIEKAIHDPSFFFDPIIRFLNNQEEFYWKIIRSDQKTMIWEKGFHLMKEKIYETFKNRVEIDDRVFSLIIDYHLTGIFEAYKNWMNDKDPHKLSVEQASNLISHMIYHGITDILAATKDRKD